MMDKQQTRRLWIRIIALVLVVVLALLMFWIGKQHTILLDNKTLDGYKAFSIVEVRVDKGERLELAARDRDKTTVTGQRHKVTVWYMDEYYQEYEKTWKFTVPLSEEMMLLSVPALVGGADQSVWLTHYEPPVATLPSSVQEEIIVSDDVSLLGDF